ncbi:hypothetical protein G8V07_14625 [Clostridium botulinum D/C]|uniref:hypothetical protein n=1 Tax=Clostridium botulinum TaxID=1491 RepID=UPI001E581D74|nr:hypothetical protein [Clostridium botulinum]MCD3321678.1 hypothetical protein [Clostridium botulinum D/C]MCD3324958.1 hypothetical protein [Clostridium botulinum D/C]MCD3327736.1 hypothetical protein [Clostridium botulinum D/C]
MFEGLKSGNISRQLNTIGYYIIEFECKRYKDKTIEDFIPNIYKDTDDDNHDTY